MTVQELKETLLGKEYTAPIRIGEHAIVVDVKQFLRIQFIECSNWKKELEKCPAYERLMQFWEVTCQ